MNSDNDPRAVDWPEKQVKRLDKDMNAAAEKLRQLDRRVTSIEGFFSDLGGEMPPEFSAPIGGAVAQEARHRGLLPETTRHGGIFAVGDPARSVVPEEQCYPAMNYVTIEKAEKRIRDYMTGHFSEATIEGVLGALRNENSGS